jgi:MSHA biogenesis protein MshN
VSLINKMLKDLEARQNAPLGRPASRRMFQDLHPVAERDAASRVLPWLAAVAAGAFIVTAYFGWQYWRAGQGDAPPLQVAEVVNPAPVVPAVSAGTNVTAEQAIPVTAEQPPLPVEPPVVAEKPAKAAPVKSASAAREKKAGSATRADIASEPEGAAGSMEKKAIPLTAEQTAENFYRAAMARMQQRQMAEAEQGLRAALGSSAKHIAAREALVGMLLERGRVAEAGPLLEQGIASVPQHTVFVRLLARIHVDQGQEGRALVLLEQKRTLAGKDADYLALLATLYQRAARHAEAASAFQEALNLRPQEGRWWVGAGISLEAQKNWPQARVAYERARSGNIDPRLQLYAEQRLAHLP